MVAAHGAREGFGGPGGPGAPDAPDPAGGELARRVPGSPSLRLAGRRLLAAIPVLWGVTLLTYLVMNMLPGDAAQELLGANATPAQVHALEIKLHLNEPFWIRYGQWLGGLLHGDLGASLTNGETVTSILGQRLPVTVELLAYSFAVSIAAAVGLAALAARRPNGIVDRASMVVSMAGLSVAPYVFALVLIYVFAVKLGWFPAIGYTPPGQDPAATVRSLTLPAAAIGFPLFAVYTRLLRADIVEQMQREDYIVTARAKGVRPWRVLLRHALPNSLFGLITLVGLNLGTLVGAVAIIEPIFSLPGVGAILIQSINDRDVPVVEGIVVVFAVIVVLANLLADLLYTALDPRIRYERAAS